MDQAWNTLVEAGLPDGAARPPPRDALDGAALRGAVSAILARPRLDPREGELLLAWAAGFRHHWPARFAAMLGPDGDRLIDALDRLPLDRNRYLKLRRIAVANLAGRL